MSIEVTMSYPVSCYQTLKVPNKIAADDTISLFLLLSFEKNKA